MKINDELYIASINEYIYIYIFRYFIHDIYNYNMTYSFIPPNRYLQLDSYKPCVTMRSFGTFTIALLGKAQRIKVAHWKRHTWQWLLLIIVYTLRWNCLFVCFGLFWLLLFLLLLLLLLLFCHNSNGFVRSLWSILFFAPRFREDLRAWLLAGIEDRLRLHFRSSAALVTAGASVVIVAYCILLPWRLCQDLTTYKASMIPLKHIIELMNF